MSFLLTIIILIACFAAIGVGYLIKQKTLRRGCGLTPEDCACLKEGKDPSQCDKEPADKKET